MKKLIALLLMLALASTLTLSALAENDLATVRTLGTLSMLNVTEEEYAAFLEARIQAGRKLFEEGYAKRPENAPGDTAEGKIVFYDTLDALLMALNAGDIDGIDIYQSVARYLCATNDNLWLSVTYDMDKERNLYDKESKWFSLTDSRPEDYTTRWLETVNCPVIRVDGTLPIQQNVDYLMSILA